MSCRFVGINLTKAPRANRVASTKPFQVLFLVASRVSHVASRKSHYASPMSQVPCRKSHVPRPMSHKTQVKFNLNPNFVTLPIPSIFVKCAEDHH